MPRPEGHRCDTCRFSQPLEHAVEIGLSLSCQRYPPQLFEGATIYGSSGFPDVAPAQWCGEYQPADPETFSEAAVQIARHVILGDRTAARGLVDKLKEDGEV